MDIAVLSTPYELNLRSDIAKRELDLEEKTKFLNKADIHIDRLVSNRDGLFLYTKVKAGKKSHSILKKRNQKEQLFYWLYLMMSCQCWKMVKYFY